MFEDILLKSIPDSYVPSIYDIKYDKLRENGIKYAVFDIDCTILPFDDINLAESDKVLFKYINNIGIQTALCSSGVKGRVKPVADELGVNYMYGARKPFVDFDSIKGLFGCNANPDDMVLVGDSLYLDMSLAGRLGINKILVDMIAGGNTFMVYPNEIMNSMMFRGLEKYDIKPKRYYRGQIER